MKITIMLIDQKYNAYLFDLECTNFVKIYLRAEDHTKCLNLFVYIKFVKKTFKIPPNFLIFIYYTNK